jgi:hypothetical protein
VAYRCSKNTVESVKGVVHWKPIHCGMVCVGDAEVAMDMNGDCKQKVRVSIIKHNEWCISIMLTRVARHLCTAVQCFIFLSPFVRLCSADNDPSWNDMPG